WKKKLYYYHVSDNEDVHELIDSISKNIIIKKNSIRFIIVTDFKDFLAIDTKSNETLDISFIEIPKNLNFFLPLTGVTKVCNIGNIYVNRNIVGAVVGVQPFGGQGLSGTGPKAGGPHYLSRLCHEHSVSNNTTAMGGNASLLTSISD
ncbi:MAG: aldehyde dehydrogenase family protein, partial [Chloroflexi bacterium]|nr:aldehyde dehydrogenase family protein [Chloroflexota bacterium]